MKEGFRVFYHYRAGELRRIEYMETKFWHHDTGVIWFIHSVKQKNYFMSGTSSAHSGYGPVELLYA